jgi:prevent-host-death family protein
MDKVGVWELRQNLSKYLRRAARGERFIVTDRNIEVAVLGPPPKTDDPWEQLIAEGIVIPPVGDLSDLPTPVRLDDPYAGTKALEEMRGEWER